MEVEQWTVEDKGVEAGERRIEDKRWRVEDGGWRIKDRKWKMEGGGSRLGNGKGK